MQVQTVALRPARSDSKAQHPEAQPAWTPVRPCGRHAYPDAPLCRCCAPADLAPGPLKPRRGSATASRGYLTHPSRPLGCRVANDLLSGSVEMTSSSWPYVRSSKRGWRSTERRNGDRSEAVRCSGGPHASGGPKLAARAEREQIAAASSAASAHPFTLKISRSISSFRRSCYVSLRLRVLFREPGGGRAPSTARRITRDLLPTLMVASAGRNGPLTPAGWPCRRLLWVSMCCFASRGHTTGGLHLCRRLGATD
jgi:hypothetical protein